MSLLIDTEYYLYNKTHDLFLTEIGPSVLSKNPGNVDLLKFMIQPADITDTIIKNNSLYYIKCIRPTYINNEKVYSTYFINTKLSDQCPFSGGKRLDCGLEPYLSIVLDSQIGHLFNIKLSDITDNNIPICIGNTVNIDNLGVWPDYYAGGDWEPWNDLVVDNVNAKNDWLFIPVNDKFYCQDKVCNLYNILTDQKYILTDGTCTNSLDIYEDQISCNVYCALDIKKCTSDAECDSKYYCYNGLCLCKTGDCSNDVIIDPVTIAPNDPNKFYELKDYYIYNATNNKWLTVIEQQLTGAIGQSIIVNKLIYTDTKQTPLQFININNSSLPYLSDWNSIQIANTKITLIIRQENDNDPNILYEPINITKPFIFQNISDFDWLSPDIENNNTDLLMAIPMTEQTDDVQTNIPEETTIPAGTHIPVGNKTIKIIQYVLISLLSVIILFILLLILFIVGKKIILRIKK